MKLKNRFKTALASFFREDLIEMFKDDKYQFYQQPLVVNNVEFETVHMEKDIDLREVSAFPNPHYIDEAIHSMKKGFANKVMDHIHVDAYDLLDTPCPVKRIRFSLRVQKKKD